MNKKKRIIFLASNNLQNDPRVQRQAEGAGKRGFDSIAVGFYWIVPGSELPEIEQKKEYQIQRILYVPGAFLKKNKIFLAIVSGIFMRLLITWLGSLSLGGFSEGKKKKEPHQEGKIQRNSWANIIRQKLNQSLGTFDYYSSMTIALAEKAIQLKPDIVHANDLDTLWAGYLVKQKTGAKLVYDAHEFWLDMGLQIPKLYILAFKLSEKYLLGKIDGFVTVNEPILKKVENYYRHKFRVPAIVVYNCPNFQKVSYVAPNPQKIKVLYHGRYALNRGLEQLTESARYLPKNVEINFRAIRDPLVESRIEKVIKKYALQNQVKILEPVPMDEMVQAAKDFDIGVVPYIPFHTDYLLCTPNKLFEYMMAGLALAVSDLPVLRYFVTRNKNGVLFNPRSPKSIAKAINALMADPVKLGKMKQNSLESVKKLNWENEQEKLISLYKQLL